ncbi:MAG TPA: hypothetical protein DEQ46_01760 [Cryomorphaceae bacterium]|nr:hypothetical protein [Cryomorphaceae bacterium]
MKDSTCVTTALISILSFINEVNLYMPKYVFTLLLIITLGCQQPVVDDVEIRQYSSEYVDGYEYRTETPCNESLISRVGASVTKEIKKLDTTFWGEKHIICQSDTIILLHDTIVFIWKAKEFAQTISRKIGFEQKYPPDAVFTWWGCIDSLEINGHSYYNPFRSGVSPVHADVHFFLDRDMLINGGDTVPCIYINNGFHKGKYGALFKKSGSKYGLVEYRNMETE